MVDVDGNEVKYPPFDVEWISVGYKYFIESVDKSGRCSQIKLGLV